MISITLRRCSCALNRFSLCNLSEFLRSTSSRVQATNDEIFTFKEQSGEKKKKNHLAFPLTGFCKFQAKQIQISECNSLLLLNLCAKRKFFWPLTRSSGSTKSNDSVCKETETSIPRNFHISGKCFPPALLPGWNIHSVSLEGYL